MKRYTLLFSQPYSFRPKWMLNIQFLVPCGLRPNHNVWEVMRNRNFFQDLVACSGFGLVVSAIQIVDSKGFGDPSIGRVDIGFALGFFNAHRRARSVRCVVLIAGIENILKGLDRDGISVIVTIVLRSLFGQPHTHTNCWWWMGVFPALIRGNPSRNRSNNRSRVGNVL